MSNKFNLTLRKIAIFMAAIMLVVAMPQLSYGADDEQMHRAATDISKSKAGELSNIAGELSNIEWWNFRNNEENNGVTNRETPINYNETTLKWANQITESYTDSCTPPLIIDGYIYTAHDQYLLKLDKQTGKLVKRSEKLQGGLGYALNPLVYAEGMIFIQISNGRVQAVDASSLESIWVSEQLGGQTLSPITYKNGYIYTGTWNSEKSDGAYFCLSVKDDNTSQKTEVKNCEWKLYPSEKGDGAKGFYWAGSYASDNYVVFGSDDGSNENSFTNTSTLYSVHPTTGAVLDKKSGLKGDIRSTVVYNSGHVYFSTKGGTLYKAKINDDGTFGAISSINLKGMMTASPIVNNGRIYIGVCGTGGQFNADGGHMFAVINDEDTLDDGSLAYTVSIPGYPQAAALLSTYMVNDSADGSAYLYFTYNAYPGGIYYLKDKPGQTSGKAEVLYKPAKNMQQQCISTISCDKEGTLYYKNDSGYLMAVTKNRAYLNDINVTADSGKTQWSEDFSTGTLQYDLKVEEGVKKVQIKLNYNSAMTVSINGNPYSGSSQEFALDSNGERTLSIQVKNGSYTREYVLNIKELTSDTSLGDLKISTSNTYDSSLISYSPEFSPSITEYTSEVYDGSRSFINLWAEANSSDSKVKVYPVENVGNKGIDSDGSLEVAGSNNGHSRYAVYFVSGKNNAKVRIIVTSENGKNRQSYYLNILRSDTTNGEIPVDTSSIRFKNSSTSIYAKGVGSSAKLSPITNIEDKNITWESGDESVATVSSDGTVKGVKPGKTTIIADIGAGSADMEVTVLEPTLKLSAYKVTLYSGNTKNKKQIYATVNGHLKQKATWKVTQGSSYASVNSSGRIMAKKKGTAIVTASVNGVNKTVTVTVKSPTFKLKTNKKALSKGSTYRIKIKANSPKGKVTYKSKNKKIATVSKSGLIKAKRKGKTTILVKCNGITRKFTVKIK